MALLMGISMLACKPDGDGPSENCVYTYQSESTQIKWTAYKLTEKVGVSGGFKTIDVVATKSSVPLDELLPGLRFDIDASSVDSGVPDRDKKIAESFFGTMQSAGKISGSIKSVKDGKASVNLSLNGESRDVEFDYELDATGLLKASSQIDMKDFGGQASLAALNKVCEAQHTGKDNLSVLWPDVKLEIQTSLKTDCK